MWVDRRKQRRPSQAERLVVYTAVFGGILDRLKPPAKFKPGAGVSFVCFSDRKRLGEEVPPWQARPVLWSGSSPRRTAGYHKVLSHLAFPDVQYSLWLDLDFQLASDPWAWVDRHLRGGVDVAVFKHPRRDCAYDEVEALTRWGEPSVGALRRQVEGYRAKGFPARNGLAETCVILRRHSPKVRELNLAWWSEIESGSERDELSFDYVMWSRKMRYGQLKGAPDRSPYVRRAA